MRKTTTRNLLKLNENTKKHIQTDGDMIYK